MAQITQGQTEKKAAAFQTGSIHAAQRTAGVVTVKNTAKHICTETSALQARRNLFDHKCMNVLLTLLSAQGTNSVLVRLICSDFTVTGPQVRLVNDYEGAINQGRVEVYHDDQWGTVCDDGFTTENAQVVCRELGLPDTDALVAAYGLFGFGDARIWMDDVICNGSESNLSECAHRCWGSNNCGHFEDVGVICGGK